LPGTISGLGADFGWRMARIFLMSAMSRMIAALSLGGHGELETFLESANCFCQLVLLQQGVG
jgi:hypothetical protein